MRWSLPFIYTRFEVKERREEKSCHQKRVEKRVKTTVIVIVTVS